MSQDEVINILRKYKKPMTANEIADKLNSNPGSVRSSILRLHDKWKMLEVVEVKRKEGKPPENVWKIIEIQDRLKVYTHLSKRLYTSKIKKHIGGMNGRRLSKCKRSFKNRSPKI